MEQPEQGQDHDGLLSEQVLRHGGYFFRVALRMLGDGVAAEDACQQAFLQAWRCRGQLRQPRAVRGWMTQVLVNECSSQLRRRQLERRALVRHTPGEPPRDPADTAAHRDGVRLALAELPEPTRTVVVLRLIEGMSGNEVKDMLGCSASEVSRRLHQGMEQLRTLLGSHVRAD